MVDIETYRRFHRLNTIENMVTEHAEEYLPLEVTESASPPTGSFTILLPPTTYGFGFHDKKWRKLVIEYAADIVWNEDMFDMLVLPESEKNILRALLPENKAAIDVLASRDRELNQVENNIKEAFYLDDIWNAGIFPIQTLSDTEFVF
ncbi:hypothetical protein FOC1_h10016975, partial [Fusarium oxysporum f. sp. cubense race 1]